MTSSLCAGYIPRFHLGFPIPHLLPNQSIQESDLLQLADLELGPDSSTYCVHALRYVCLFGFQGKN